MSWDALQLFLFSVLFSSIFLSLLYEMFKMRVQLEWSCFAFGDRDKHRDQTEPEERACLASTSRYLLG